MNEIEETKEEEESEQPTHSQPQNAGEETFNTMQVRTFGKSTLGKLEQRLLDFEYFKEQVSKMMDGCFNKRKDKRKFLSFYKSQFSLI